MREQHQGNCHCYLKQLLSSTMLYNFHTERPLIGEVRMGHVSLPFSINGALILASRSGAPQISRRAVIPQQY